MNFAGFDWDAGNWPKCGKHGVSKAEIEHALTHGARVAPDLKHSDLEDRFVAVGQNQKGRPIFIGITFRIVEGKQLVRPLTARYMHAKEAQRYATQSAENENR